MAKLLVVVEGQGDVLAVPLLTRRILHERYSIYDVEICNHRRRDLSHLRANDWAHFRRYLAAAFNEECPVLWVLDCDDDCAWQVAQEISRIAVECQVRWPFAVAFWVKEFESLFLYDFENTREKLGIGSEIEPPAEPYLIRGVKEWLSDQLPRGRIYKEMVDQPRLAGTVDIDLLMDVCRAFQHFVRAIDWLLHAENSDVYPIRDFGAAG